MAVDAKDEELVAADVRWKRVQFLLMSSMTEGTDTITTEGIEVARQ